MNQDDGKSPRKSVVEIFKDYVNYIVSDVNPGLTLLTYFAVTVSIFSLMLVSFVLIGLWVWPLTALIIFGVGLIISYRANNPKP